MARKKTLPLIEDFDNIPEAALVPEDEQPYEIPRHWRWVRLGTVLNPMETRKPSGNYFTYIDIDAIDNNTQTIAKPKEIATIKAPSRASRGVRPGDTLFSLVRPYLMNIAFVEAQFSEAIASTGFYVCSPIEAVDQRYLFHMLSSSSFVNRATEWMRGDNSPSIKSSDFVQLPVPLPPIDEQKAIAVYIEQTHTKIDDAIQRLDAFLDDFPNRRFDLVRALLAGHGLPDHGGDPKQQWETLPLGEILRVSSGCGLTAKEMNSSGTVPVYGGNGITGYHDQACYPAGTIAIGRVGFYCGSVHMSLEECWVTDNALVASFDENQIDRRFLYFLLGHTNLRINTSSSAQPLISGKKIYDIPVNIPSRDTQKAIVKHVEASLEYLDRIETLAVKSRDELTGLRALVVQQALQGAFAASPIR